MEKPDSRFSCADPRQAREIGRLLRELPPLRGEPVRIEDVPGLRDRRGPVPAGCFPRDRVTQRTIEEVQAGTGKWARNAEDTLPDAWLTEGLARGAAPQDGDGDGMPDDWESKHGLNKADGDDHKKVMASGYTAIEEYLNERAASLIGGR